MSAMPGLTTRQPVKRDQVSDMHLKTARARVYKEMPREL